MTGEMSPIGQEVPENPGKHPVEAVFVSQTSQSDDTGAQRVAEIRSQVHVIASGFRNRRIGAALNLLALRAILEGEGVELVELVPPDHFARADFTPIAPPAVTVLGGGPRNKAQWKAETQRGRRHGRG